jgi:hypothetical protein
VRNDPTWNGGYWFFHIDDSGPTEPCDNQYRRHRDRRKNDRWSLNAALLCSISHLLMPQYPACSCPERIPLESRFRGEEFVMSRSDWTPSGTMSAKPVLKQLISKQSSRICSRDNIPNPIGVFGFDPLDG